MFYSSQFLFLASGVKNDEGFWFIGVKNSDENILDDKNLLDCHRKELIGKESANDILFAINLNLKNLFDEIEINKFLINQPLLINSTYFKQPISRFDLNLEYFKISFIFKDTAPAYEGEKFSLNGNKTEIFKL